MPANPPTATGMIESGVGVVGWLPGDLTISKPRLDKDAFGRKLHRSKRPRPTESSALSAFLRRRDREGWGGTLWSRLTSHATFEKTRNRRATPHSRPS